jgi:Protein of unknown function (DUF2568)
VTDAVRDAAARAPGPAHAPNLAVRFLLELGALAALGVWGVDTGQSLLADIALGGGAPLLAAVVWGTLAAPKSKWRLHGTALLAVQLFVLGSAAAGLAVAGHALLGALFAGLVVLNTVLLQRWQGEPTP